MRKEVVSLLLLGVFSGGFVAGLAAYSRHEGARDIEAPSFTMGSDAENFGGPRGPRHDEIHSLQSSVVPGDARSAPTAESLADPRVRAGLEKMLRDTPFAVLKQIYLERQDQQFERLQARYAQPKDLTDAELEHRADRLFESFRQNAGANNYYVSRGEMKLRGGKTVPYVALVEYYASGPEHSELPLPGAGGRDFCYTSGVYFRIGEKFASDGQATCLAWASVRRDQPFVLHSNYSSKRLAPYFDSLALALPGFGDDRDTNSEWYDSSGDQWTSLGHLRFDPISKDEFTSLSKETQHETTGD